MRRKRGYYSFAHISIEAFRRLLEMLGLGTIVSFLIRTIVSIDFLRFNTPVIWPVIFCGVFQAVNIWLCRRSNRRMGHFRFAYYRSNLTGCLLYALIGLCCLFMNPNLFLKVFYITISLTGKTKIGLHGIIMIYARFFLLTAAMIALAKETKSIFRMIRKKMQSSS